MTTTLATTTRATYASPVGRLTLIASDAGLCAVLWDGDDPARTGFAAAPPGEHADTSPVLAETGHQLDAYFAGTRTSFDLPLDLQGTPFQLAAWHALAEIPYGETRTYAEQAARLGRPNAFRAVGAANGRNPLSIVLPCHRVVGSDGSLTGFAGGLETKRWLLQHDGSFSGKRASLREVRNPLTRIPAAQTPPEAGNLRFPATLSTRGQTRQPARRGVSPAFRETPPPPARARALVAVRYRYRARSR